MKTVDNHLSDLVIRVPYITKKSLELYKIGDLDLQIFDKKLPD